MRAVRIHQFGSPDGIVIDDVAQPTPSRGELLVQVVATGVGPWDALIREGKSMVNPPLPLTLGSDLSGVVEATGPEVSEFKAGDQVYGVTNKQFCGANAEYALASSAMMAHRPATSSDIEAASVPVVAVTAWQMLFEYAHAKTGQTVLIHGAAGNVGAYAVQLARNARIEVIATASSKDLEYVRSLGAAQAIDHKATRFEEIVSGVDVVIDTVGGETRERSFQVLKPGGALVSVVPAVSEEMAKRYGVKAVFFLVDVTRDRLNTISGFFNRGELVSQVGTVLPLEKARIAHQMIDGAPHHRGKIVLSVAAQP